MHGHFAEAEPLQNTGASTIAAAHCSAGWSAIRLLRATSTPTSLPRLKLKSRQKTYRWTVVICPHVAIEKGVGCAIVPIIIHPVHRITIINIKGAHSLHAQKSNAHHQNINTYQYQQYSGSRMSFHKLHPLC
jgi:hypothetical protein